MQSRCQGPVHTTVLHCCHMKSLNETKTPIFVLLHVCVLCFQGDPLQSSSDNVWSGFLLYVGIFYTIRWFRKRTAMTMIRMRRCTGWSLFAYVPFLHFRRVHLYYNVYKKRRKGQFWIHTWKAYMSSRKGSFFNQNFIYFFLFLH